MELQNKTTETTAMTTQAKRVLGLRVATGAAAVGGLALLAPVIWGAVSAGAGVLVLGGIGVLGIGLFQSLPLIGQKWENRLLAARKAEARENPIEQLQMFFQTKRERVTTFKMAVAQIGAQIKGMREMLDERKRAKPGYDAPAKEKAIKDMTAAHQTLVLKYTNAEKALDELSEVIEDKKFDWKFGQAGKVALQNMNATSGQDVLDQMLADEAFDSVRTNFNQVFAELEMEAAKINSTKELTFDDGMTIDLSNITLPVAEKVRR